MGRFAAGFALAVLHYLPVDTVPLVEFPLEPFNLSNFSDISNNSTSLAMKGYAVSLRVCDDGHIAVFG